MGHRSVVSIFVGLAVCYFMCLQSTFAKEMTFKDLENDPVERLLSSYFQQIGSLRGQFDVLQDDKPIMHVTLDWDKGRDFYKATRSYVVKPGEPQNVRTWVLNNKREWSARPEPEGPTPGAWDIKTSPAGQGILPRDVNLGEYRIAFLRQALVPYMTRHGIPNILKDGLATMDVTETKNAAGLIDRKYTFSAVQGNKAGMIMYTMDRTDGLRIHRIVVTDMTDNKPVVLFTGEYQGFQKSKGIWVPTEIKESELNLLNNQMTVQGHLVFNSLEVNVPFGPEDFVFQPPHGSLVMDTETGLVFRAGFQNPLAITKPDDVSLPNPEVLGDNRAGATQAVRARQITASNETQPPLATPSPVGKQAQTKLPIIGMAVVLAILVIGAMVWIRSYRHRAGV